MATPQGIGFGLTVVQNPWRKKGKDMESKYCSCGENIMVEHGVVGGFRRDGLRFFKASDKDRQSRNCLFRCPICHKVIEYLELKDSATDFAQQAPSGAVSRSAVMDMKARSATC